MTIIVQKYGGTSVGSVERINAVADRILKTLKTTSRLVIVVSAMGKNTNLLVGLANEVSSKPDPREYDALVSTGEMVSASLLSMMLIEKGQKAISLTGYQAGIKTDNGHSRAKIQNIKPDRILQELDLGKVVVITGFQGVTEQSDVTTIGRGGSDTSAVVLAASLGCSECEILTDVTGIYTTDPRIEPRAKKLSSISYEEMLDLASLGAGVLHPRAVEAAMENKITLHVRSSFKDTKGTRVKEIKTMEIKKPVTGIALKKEEAKLSVIGVPDKSGVAALLFTHMAQQGINIDMIIQSTEENGTNTITFTISREDFIPAKSALNSLLKPLGAVRIDSDNNISKVSIIGVGMISKPGVAAKMFSVLAKHNINIQLITTSEIKISCAIHESNAQKAVQVLHDAFELDMV